MMDLLVKTQLEEGFNKAGFKKTPTLTLESKIIKQIINSLHILQKIKEN